jgi:esterase/lipase superfamily enzyme
MNLTEAATFDYQSLMSIDKVRDSSFLKGKKVDFIVVSGNKEVEAVKKAHPDMAHKVSSHKAFESFLLNNETIA